MTDKKQGKLWFVSMLGEVPSFIEAKGYSVLLFSYKVAAGSSM